MELSPSVEETLSLSQYLKRSTRGDHDGVDRLVMSVSPFANESNYRRFLVLQHLFHASVDPLYHHPTLEAWLPGLSSLPRLSAVQADMQDLGVSEALDATELASINDLYEAIGWLYCSEGSNIGAAFLYKETQKLHFNDQYGARHLAGHVEGRGQQWRKFVAKLDALELTCEQRKRVLTGAIDAFSFYRTRLGKVF